MVLFLYKFSINQTFYFSNFLFNSKNKIKFLIFEFFWIFRYIFDKVQRKLHLSKTRQVKFNESGHLAVFSIYSMIHAGVILNELAIHKDLVKKILYPH